MRDIVEPNDAVAWFTGELDNLLTSIRLAAMHGFHTHAWQLAAVLTTFMYRQVRWHQWTDMLQVAADSARQPGDQGAEARINRILGTAYARLGLYADAHEVQERALHTFRELGDASSQAHTLLMLCRLFNWQGRHNDALDCAAEALRLYEETNHPGRARAMIDLGRSNTFLHQYEKASNLADRALLLCRDGDDLDGKCTALALLGDVHYNLNDFGRAVEAYGSALELWRTIGDRYQEAETLVRLADSFAKAGEEAASHASRREARWNRLSPANSCEISPSGTGHPQPIRSRLPYPSPEQQGPTRFPKLQASPGEGIRRSPNSTRETAMPPTVVPPQPLIAKGSGKVASNVAAIEVVAPERLPVSEAVDEFGVGGQLCHDVGMPVVRQVRERRSEASTQQELDVEPTRGIEVHMLGAPHHGHITGIPDEVKQKRAPVQILEVLRAPIVHL